MPEHPDYSVHSSPNMWMPVVVPSQPAVVQSNPGSQPVYYVSRPGPPVFSDQAREPVAAPATNQPLANASQPVPVPFAHSGVSHPPAMVAPPRPLLSGQSHQQPLLALPPQQQSHTIPSFGLARWPQMSPLQTDTPVSGPGFSASPADNHSSYTSPPSSGHLQNSNPVLPPLSHLNGATSSIQDAPSAALPKKAEDAAHPPIHQPVPSWRPTLVCNLPKSERPSLADSNILPNPAKIGLHQPPMGQVSSSLEKWRISSPPMCPLPSLINRKSSENLGSSPANLRMPRSSVPIFTPALSPPSLHSSPVVKQEVTGYIAAAATLPSLSNSPSISPGSPIPTYGPAFKDQLMLPSNIDPNFAPAPQRFMQKATVNPGTPCPPHRKHLYYGRAGSESDGSSSDVGDEGDNDDDSMGADAELQSTTRSMHQGPGSQSEDVAISVILARPASSQPICLPNGRFRCPLCPRNYKHSKHVRRHIINHTKIFPYVCPVCNVQFRRRDACRRHLQNLHPSAPENRNPNNDLTVRGFIEVCVDSHAEKSP